MLVSFCRILRLALPPRTLNIIPHVGQPGNRRFGYMSEYLGLESWAIVNFLHVNREFRYEILSLYTSPKLSRTRSRSQPRQPYHLRLAHQVLNPTFYNPRIDLLSLQGVQALRDFLGDMQYLREGFPGINESPRKK